MSGWMLVGVGLTVLLASGAQQLVGFGFSLIAVPLFVTLLSPADSVALAAMASLAAGAGMAWGLRNRIDRKVLGRISVGALVGLPLGTLVLKVTPVPVLKVGIAVAVLSMVVVLARGYRMRSQSTGTDIAAGFLAGAMGSSVGMSGPPVVVLMQAADMEQHRFRATTVSFFVVCNVVTIPLLLANDVVSAAVWPATAVAVPASILGSLGFAPLAAKVPGERFRPLVLGVLVLSSLVALASAL